MQACLDPGPDLLEVHLHTPCVTPIARQLHFSLKVDLDTGKNSINAMMSFNVPAVNCSFLLLANVPEDLTRSPVAFIFIAESDGNTSKNKH